MTKIENYQDFEEPRRGEDGRPVLCTNCGWEIEATGTRVYPLELAGCRDYVWRHVTGGSDVCVMKPRHARPYDDFEAHRLLVAAIPEEA